MIEPMKLVRSRFSCEALFGSVEGKNTKVKFKKKETTTTKKKSTKIYQFARTLRNSPVRIDKQGALFCSLSFFLRGKKKVREENFIAPAWLKGDPEQLPAPGVMLLLKCTTMIELVARDWLLANWVDIFC
jgi:hypothetical protein